MLKLKVSLLSKTVVEYFPLSIVISTSRYASVVAHSVAFLRISSRGASSCTYTRNKTGTDLPVAVHNPSP